MSGANAADYAAIQAGLSNSSPTPQLTNEQYTATVAAASSSGQIGTPSASVASGVTSSTTSSTNPTSPGAYLASPNNLGIWARGLQTASWRGLPFAVRASQIKRGRRVAIHDYPFRDEVWVEDLGRGRRFVSFNAFLVGDDVFAQRNAMSAACDVAGAGQLVHPSLGALTATNIEFSAGERADLGRVVEIEFSFIQSGQDQPLYPTAVASTQNATNTAADNAGTTNWNSYNQSTVGTPTNSADLQAQYASIQANMGQVSTAQTPEQAVAAVASASPPTPVPDGMEQQFQGINQGTTPVAQQTPQQAVAAVAAAQPPTISTTALNAGKPGATSWP